MLYIAADHGGYPLKEELKRFLIEGGYEVVDLGADELDLADDFPDYAHKLAEQVAQDEDAGGILICATGQGMCMAANKISGVRAVMVHNDFTALDAAGHLNANVICLGGKITGPEEAKKLVKIWLDTEFDESERLVRRLRKIEEMEEN